MATTVVLTPTDHSSPDSPVELDFTPTTECWLEELLIYLVESQVPSVIGRLNPTKPYATIFVNNDTYDNLHGCLRDESFDVYLTYDTEYSVSGFYCVGSEALLRKSGIEELGLAEKVG